MPYYIKEKIYLVVIIIFCFNCGIEEKFRSVQSDIDDKYIEITGTLSHGDSLIDVGIVLLLEGTVSLDLNELKLNLEDLKLSNGTVSLYNGKYNIFNVDNGEYYVVAIEDNNKNLEYDPDIDRVGLYGFSLYDFDIIPDVVTVIDEDVEDININYFFKL